MEGPRELVEPTSSLPFHFWTLVDTTVRRPLSSPIQHPDQGLRHVLIIACGDTMPPSSSRRSRPNAPTTAAALFLAFSEGAGRGADMCAVLLTKKPCKAAGCTWNEQGECCRPPHQQMMMDDVCATKVHRLKAPGCTWDEHGNCRKTHTSWPASCAAAKPLPLKADAASVESLVRLVAAQPCTVDEVGPRDVRLRKGGILIRRLFPRQLTLKGLVVLSTSTWKNLSEGDVLSITFALAGDTPPTGGANHAMMLPAAGQDHELQGIIREYGVVGRLTNPHWHGGNPCLTGTTTKDTWESRCGEELRAALRLRDVYGWPSPLAAGCVVIAGGGVPQEAPSNCSLIQLLVVQERRLTSDQLAKAGAACLERRACGSGMHVGEKSQLPRCIQMGWGARQCHLERLMSSLAHFEQLTEGGQHRIGLFEHLLQPQPPNVCGQFSPGQLCFSAWDGGAAVCDTDHVSELHSATKQRHRRELRAKLNLPANQSVPSATLPSSATAMDWWLAGEEWGSHRAPPSAAANYLDCSPPRYDLPCSFVATFIRPLIPLLSNLSALAEDVESRHLALADAFHSMGGAALAGGGTTPMQGTHATTLRQLSFACMRGRIRELLPLAKQLDAANAAREPETKTTNQGAR